MSGVVPQHHAFRKLLEDVTGLLIAFGTFHGIIFAQDSIEVPSAFLSPVPPPYVPAGEKEVMPAKDAQK